MTRLINDGWEFLKLPNGSILSDAKNSNGWIPVDLPHDWLIWQADLYESADAWYRRTFRTETGMPPVCLIHFDGIYMDCDIFLNDQLIDTHAYGYTAFTVNLSGHLLPGDNELAVHVRHRSPNSRWYSGSGIFRDVTMMFLPESHIIPDSFYIHEHRNGNEWNIAVTAETAGNSGIPFQFDLLDRDMNPVATACGCSEGSSVSAAFCLQNASPWSVSSPYLYTLRWQYGKQTGIRKLGLRSVRMDPDTGLYINDEPVKLKGVCLHHDLGALGASFHEKAARRQLKLMQDMGVNALRTSHNPPAEKLLDLCDELGILVVDEAFDMWERPKTQYDYARFFPAWEERDVASWIRRDRCHPSVIMWSIGNEIYDIYADLRGAEVTRMLKDQVEFHDPARHAAVTFGCNYMPWEGGQRCADIVKTAGYNYGENLYAEHHRQHPDWIIYGSETGSVLSSRGVYHFPIEKPIMSEADLQCSALGNSNTSWGASDLRRMIVDDMHCPYSMGQFIWSGIDYIGEPTPYHTRSCYFGQADTACFPKDPYYLFQSIWGSTPVLHIGVSWDWNPGQLIDIPVMTNCASAELFLNGKSLGKKTVDHSDAVKCLPVWKTAYVPGTLKAVGYNAAGLEMMADTRITPKDTDHFVMSAEDIHLLSDGYDITFVDITAADCDGNPVLNARDRVHITVSGGGCLLGTDNGDSSDPDGYKSCNRRLFNGKLLLIIGSTGAEDDAVIRLESPGLPCSELIIPVAGAPRKPGTTRILRIPDLPGPESVPVRKIEIEPIDSIHLNPSRRECRFRFRTLPAHAQRQKIIWQVTNASGIESPYAALSILNDDEVCVRVSGDGDFYLRAMTGEQEDHADFISQIEFSAEGIGSPALDPYSFVSAGLYDLHSGNIGTGNEKGVAFDREGESMIGFSFLDFGKAGSDTLTMPVFALDDNAYDIELFDGDPGNGGQLIQVLRYQKPSIWNVYQEETFHLNRRLTGIRSLCFRMHQKVHLRGFRFERQSRAFIPHTAAEADRIYGDAYTAAKDSIRGIGNNVTLSFDGMDFGDAVKTSLEINGYTPLHVNTITIRFTGPDGSTHTEAIDFRGTGDGIPTRQVFSVRTPGGLCDVSFVFLPGSQFDFDSFKFSKPVFPE